ncbi:MAG: SDR family oxidoreductase [Desulfobacterales bacterium]|jgi:NAD(P)-dependent dehydrogenase (short-subunit alcohol dehydrogenase family)|nr:SDR family oxidoreductase [Desulfobacterales bacterium]MDP6808207.1 SDR family oxidoreductase [Desulfobacterales bacterium]|tara:strand:+ start:17035 stop:17811 length:777 start_codon:yes stop_codon:yes gene_type:complete
MGQNFKDKRVLITGASKGLGKAAAIAFEEEGARLMLAARSADKLKALYDSFSEPGNHLVFNCDLLDSENIKMLTVDATKNWGGVDIILHCIGGSMGVNDTLVDWEAFSKCLKGNIGIASEINRHLVSGMKEQGSGNIIHVGSIVSSEARASVPYNTAKAALSGYVRSLGKELAAYSIIVAGILPGAFYGENNAMFRYEYYKPEEYRDFVKSLPEGRMPIADEYIPMLFLLSNPAMKIMSGSLISMDGAQGQAYYNFST